MGKCWRFDSCPVNFYHHLQNSKIETEFYSEKMTAPIFTSFPAYVRDYVLDKEIGNGGFGVVYHATCTKYEGFEFAIKVSPVSEARCAAIESAYESEVKALQRLDHGNVVRLYDFFTDPARSLLFVVLEYCPGGDLEEKIQSNEKIPVNEQRSIAKQIISAVCYCHQNHIAHRDLKTGNILFDQYGRIKVADFGLCKETTRGFVETFNGSLLYAPPELLKGLGHDPFQADIWSLGVLLYRLVTGQYPWPLRCRNQLRESIMTGEILPIETPHPLLKLIKRMIVVDPKARITSEELEKLDLWQEQENPVLRRGISVHKSSDNISLALGARESKSVTTSMGLLALSCCTPKRRRVVRRYTNCRTPVTFRLSLSPFA